MDSLSSTLLALVAFSAVPLSSGKPYGQCIFPMDIVYSLRPLYTPYGHCIFPMDSVYSLWTLYIPYGHYIFPMDSVYYM